METAISIALLTHSDRLVSPEFSRELSGLGDFLHVPRETLESPDGLRRVLNRSDIAVTGWGTPPLPLPDPGARLRYLCHMTGELKRIIPKEIIDNPEVQVTNWGDSFAFATAEGAVALLFAVLKNFVTLDAEVRQQGRAAPLRRSFYSLRGTRIGIYGLSSIGRLVARYLRPFSPVLSFYDPTVADIPEGLTRRLSLDELFAGNDIVTIHAGLNDATRGSVDYRRLSLLPEHGILINTSRGPLVVESDLARILNEGRIHAGIDVIDHEEDWRLSPLARCPDVVLSGHVLSHIGRQEKSCLQETALDNIRRFMAGKPLLHRVTAERYRVMT